MIKYHLLSYPRSGNHLFRGVFEFYTKIPSVGCVDSPTDVSIFEKNPSFYVPKSKDPILFKAHFAHEIFYRENRYKNNQWRLIFLFRDPFEAISSHITHSLRWYHQGFISKKIIKKIMKSNIGLYLNNINLYQSSKLNKISINYKEMISGSRINIFDEFDLNFNDEKIIQITKNSQQSIKRDTSEAKVILKESKYADILKKKYQELLSERQGDSY